MANKKFTDFPSVGSATVSDIIWADQGGSDVQETLGQVIALALSTNSLNFSGNPNGNLAGSLYQTCYDKTNAKYYICTTAGTSVTAVWTLIGANIIAPIQGGTGIASPTAHTIPIAQGSSNFTFLGPLTNGQLPIGSTGADPVATTITSGVGVTVTNGPGSITISATAGGMGWTDVTGATQVLAVNNGYIADRGAGNVAFSLPASSALGDIIEIVGRLNGWSVSQAAGQSIIFGTLTSTVGVGGSIASTNAHDCIRLVCSVANTEWIIRSAVGNITVI